ncbi:MAG TPA: carboxypeptidase regulatory-like domain-containing protein [Candidatus Dormibacteraeota bacterium]|nr:carboxypeptidase regulatory-like domain-containing protein [Candidatus Dormibacteraeota bacterium]
MKKMTWGLLLLVSVWALAGALVPAWSQEVTAAIVGTVTDPSGAPIAGATVTATDTERGTVWTATTNDTGAYNLLRLPVGSYTVKVASQGFQSAQHAAFTLVLNQTARVDVQLKVGKISETVEVTGAAPVLQTQSVDVSTLIDATTNVSLPLASRNYLQLTLLAPGATNVDPDSMRQPRNMLGSGRPYINGNREQANEYLVDGILNSEDKNNETGYQPSVDAIQEFNLITQNASAEFGNYQGGIVSASIKSGTNRFHGDLYEFFRNDALNANKASAGWTEGVNNGVLGFNAQGVQNKPELRYNQFGGTIGGPIIKNKLFFFADYQGQRLVNAGPTGAQLLTSLARSGDFSQLCNTGFTGPGGVCADAAFGPNALDLDSQGNPKNTAPVAGNQLVVPNSGGANTLYYLNPAQIPAGNSQPTPIASNNMANAPSPYNTVDPVTTAIFNSTKYYPLPQTNSLAANNFFYKSGNNLNNNQGDLKIDYVASQKDHIFGRWSQMDLNQPFFTGCLFCNAGAGEENDEPVRNTVVDWTHSISTNLLNEARAGFNAVRFDSRQTPTSSLGNISEQLGIAGGNFQAPGLVQLNIVGNNGGSAALGLQNLIQVFHDTQIQFEDNLIFTHGRHQIKTGFQFVRQRQDYIYQGNNGALGYLGLGTATGSGLADFWLGNVVGGAGSQRDTGGVVSNPAKLRGNVFGAFVQDDWRLTDTLTVNMGLRFEDHTPQYEVDNRSVNFGLYTGTIYTANGADGTAKFGNQALYNNYLGIGDWQPRVGISWAPSRLNGKTVIRAGFGISQFMEGGGSNEELTLNLPFGILQQQATPGGVGTLSQGFGATANTECPGGINQACYEGGVRLRIFDQNFKPAMISQWNLTLQHQFSNSLTFQVGYVGQHGAHLLNFEDVAQSIPLDAQGKVAGAGDPIVTRVPGPFLGGGTPGSLYLADNPQFNAPNCGTAGNPACFGHQTLAGTNMSNSDQKYHALQAVLQKRMSNGLQAQVAYTWSKCMSNSPGYFGTGWGSTQATSSGGQPGWENIYNPRLNWGPCYYDQTHVLTSYVTYQLPFGRGKQFGHDMSPALNAVIGNWEIGGIVTLHTGNALTLNNFGGWGVGGNSDNTNGIGPYTLANLPDCNGAVHVLNQKVPVTGGSPAYIQWVDPSNVSPAAANTFGTCSVGNVRGPGYANVDLSLHKDFLITEAMKAEFRFEALNAFNHPVWTFAGGPANGSFDPGQTVFGRIVDSQGARQLQLALKFYF